MNVAVLFNPPALAPDHPDYESERGVLDSVDAISAALNNAGHVVRLVAAPNSTPALETALTTLRPEVVVNLCESFDGSSALESHVAAIMEKLGLAITGSGSECLALARDKSATKQLLTRESVNVPRGVLISSFESRSQDVLRALLNAGPVIVKPAAEDASLGIGPASVVQSITELDRQIESVVNRYGAVLVEQYIAGREFNVAIVSLPKQQVLPLAEIEFQTSDALPWPIVTYDAKWSMGSRQDIATPVRCPAKVEPELAQRIRETALRAYLVLGCRDYARIDVRVAESGDAYVIDVNANPDLAPTAGMARALGAAGMQYHDFVERLVQTAATRNGRDRATS